MNGISHRSERRGAGYTVRHVKSSTWRYLFVSLIAVFPSYAEDTNENYAVWGIGQSSCHSYTQAREAGEYTDYKLYLMGYMTAYNSLIPDTYNITGTRDLNEILAWIDAHCKKTEMDSYEHALRQMVTEMRETRLKKAMGGQSWGKQNPTR